MFFKKHRAAKSLKKFYKQPERHPYDNTYFSVTLPLSDEEIQAIRQSKDSCYMLEDYDEYINDLSVDGIHLAIEVIFNIEYNSVDAELITEIYFVDGTKKHKSQYIDFNAHAEKYYINAALRQIAEHTNISKFIKACR